MELGDSRALSLRAIVSTRGRYLTSQTLDGKLVGVQCQPSIS